MNSLKMALTIQPFESFFCADKTLIYIQPGVALPFVPKKYITQSLLSTDRP